MNEKGILHLSLDGENWKKYYIGTFVEEIFSIDYGNGYYVLASDHGLFVSTDLIKWENIVPQYEMCSANYGNNLFVAVGMNGAILTSKVDTVNLINNRFTKKTNKLINLQLAKKQLKVSFPEILFNKNCRINIFTPAGRLVNTYELQANNGNLAIPLSKINSGHYIVSAEYEGKRNVFKLLVPK